VRRFWPARSCALLLTCNIAACHTDAQCGTTMVSHAYMHKDRSEPLTHERQLSEMDGEVPGLP
jgi:hypothetical protein